MVKILLALFSLYIISNLYLIFFLLDSKILKARSYYIPSVQDLFMSLHRVLNPRQIQW